MNICLVTNAIYDPVPEYVQYTNALKQLYCDSWGIEYLFTSENPLPHLHPQWCKTTFMLKALEEYDWAVWIDCDAATVGMEFDLGGFLSTVGDKVVIAKDINGWNSGVLAVSNKERSMKWLNYIHSLRDEPKYRNGWREQQAMSDSFSGSWKGIELVPQSGIGWNSYLDIYGRKEPNLYEHGHWVLHIPGVRDEIRDRIFGNGEWIAMR